MTAAIALKVAGFAIEQTLRIIDWATGRKPIEPLPEEEPTMPSLTHKDVEHQRDQMRSATSKRQPPPRKR
jgi:hypothetical protein